MRFPELGMETGHTIAIPSRQGFNGAIGLGCEVAHRAGDNHKAVDPRRGRDQSIANGTGIGYLRRGASLRHGGIHWQDALGKRRQDAFIKPGPQQGAWERIASLHEQGAGFPFLNDNNRNKKSF